MRGVYNASIDIDILEAEKTLIYIETPETMCIEVLAAYITNRSLITNQQITGELLIGDIPVVTPTGTTIDPVPTETLSGATNLTTILGDITDDEPTFTSSLYKEGSSVLIGFRYDPVPENRIIIPPSKILGLRLAIALETAFDATVTLIYREIG